MHISLTRGKCAIVDDEDFIRLNQWKWYCLKERNGFTAARTVQTGGSKKRILMHREIMRPPDGMQVDHINHDGLDNRRENLRICTNAENQMNTRPRGGTSQYIGVCWHKRDKRWSAKIQFCHKSYHLGNYATEEEAARAYDKAARKLHREFATTNFGKKNEA